MKLFSCLPAVNGLMMIALACSLEPAQARLEARETEVLSVPSGQSITFQEAFVDHSPAGRTARFRFVAPHLRAHMEAAGYVAIEADLVHLCEQFALSRIVAPLPELIVISLAEAPIEFGSFDPDVMQVFEAYKPAGESCVWEAL